MDGTYGGSANTIDNSNVPPAGSAGNFTTIRAYNIPGQNGVNVYQPCKVIFSAGAGIWKTTGANALTYCKFEGIRFHDTTTFTGDDRNYFKQCAFKGTLDGNNATCGINGAFNLLEDCVAFDKGRYKFLTYDYGSGSTGGDNVYRRCIVRSDWAKRDDAGQDPLAAFASYHNKRTQYLNCIVIDGDTPSQWMDDPSQLAGGFYQPNNTDAGYAMRVEGCIIVNWAMGLVYTQGGSGHIVKNLAAAKVAGGLYLRGDTAVNNVSIVDLGLNNFSYRSSTQSSEVLGGDNGVIGDGAIDFYDSILRDIAADGVNSLTVTSDYINMYAIGGTDYVGSSPGANVYSTDPFSNGLLYPPRIEIGSNLYTEGQIGGILGANIINKLGIDGTFKDDADYDTLQGALWPWPLEGWVRAELQQADYATDPNRGFCATGQTLSGYIMNQFGNGDPY